MKRRIALLGSLMITLFIFALPLSAQEEEPIEELPRTWISGVGDDANPCTRTAPCKTFAGALLKTTGKGEINVLDPGGYGAVTINKSVTIDGTGTFASMVVGSTNGIVINAGVDDVVTIRGISINGAGFNPGLVGIKIIQAKTVIIEDCVIFGFLGGGDATTGIGIYDARTSGAGKLIVTNTNIRNNRTAHILIKPTGSAIVNGTIDNVRMESVTAGNGFMALSNANMTIRNSVISGNVGSGIHAEELSGNVELHVENTSITNNGTGVFMPAGSGGGFSFPGSNLSTPSIYLSNTTISGNNQGVIGSGINSYGNNRIGGNNTGNGPFSAALKQQ